MRRENNPNKVKSVSRVSFAAGVGDMVMRNTRMDWELPGFKRNANKSDSINGPSGELLHLVCLQMYSS